MMMQLLGDSHKPLKCDDTELIMIKLNLFAWPGYQTISSLLSLFNTSGRCWFRRRLRCPDGLNNATAPLSSHIAYIALLLAQDGRNAFNFYDTKLCQERFFPAASLRGDFKGNGNTCCHSFPAFQMDHYTHKIGASDVPSDRTKINSERKSVKDVQCSALINAGLNQLGVHDCCVNISAVTQLGLGAE